TELVELMDEFPIPLNDGSDAPLFEESAQLLPILRFDLVVLEDIKMSPVGIRCRWKCELRDGSEPRLIQACEGSPPRNVRVVALQLDPQNRRLHIVQPRIEAPGAHHAIRAPPMIAQQSYLLSHRVVVCHNTSTIAKAAKRLGWIEADRPGQPERAGRAPLELRSQGLARVLDDEQAVLAGD